MSTLRKLALLALLLGGGLSVEGAQCHLLLLGAGTCGSAAEFDPEDDLVFYGSLDEASGNLIDAVGALDLTETGTIDSAAGAGANTATSRDFELDSTEYGVHVDDSVFSLSADQAFTISVWANLESEGATRMIASKDTGSGAGREYFVAYSSTLDTFVCNTYDSTSTVHQAAWTANTTTATWYHIVCGHDPANDRMFIIVNNGTPAYSATFSTGTRDTTTSFMIGAFVPGTPANHWDGKIDEYGFWKRVLTAVEITWLYNDSAGRSYTEIVNYVP